MKEDLLDKKQVLVVDDNVINQMVVTHSLIKLGAAADVANDGKEALAQMKVKNYDLILMDIQMPHLDGYDTTRYIRNQLKSQVPIVAMTAFALNGEDKKCLESGMNGYVAKPFTLESLYNSINKVINTKLSVVSDPHVISQDDTLVDLSMLYEIAGSDEAYINTMISTFLENLPLILQKIEEAYASKDWQAVGNTAHYAKSSLSVVKIAEVFDWVYTIEQNAKKKVELESIPTLINLIKQKYKVAEKLLKKMIAEHQSTVMA